VNSTKKRQIETFFLTIHVESNTTEITVSQKTMSESKEENKEVNNEEKDAAQKQKERDEHTADNDDILQWQKCLADKSTRAKSLVANKNPRAEYLGQLRDKFIQTESSIGPIPGLQMPASSELPLTIYNQGLICLQSANIEQLHNQPTIEQPHPTTTASAHATVVASSGYKPLITPKKQDDSDDDSQKPKKHSNDRKRKSITIYHNEDTMEDDDDATESDTTIAQNQNPKEYAASAKRTTRASHKPHPNTSERFKSQQDRQNFKAIYINKAMYEAVVIRDRSTKSMKAIASSFHEMLVQLGKIGDISHLCQVCHTLLLPVQTAIGNPSTDIRLHISQHKKRQKKTISSAWLPGASTTIAVAGFDWIKHDPRGLLYIFPFTLPKGSIIGVVGGRVVHKGSKWQDLLDKTELHNCI